MYSTGSWLGCKKGRVLFGRLWIFHCERKTKRIVILSIVRGSMVRRNSSSQNVTRYRKLLAMRKKLCIFFFLFSLVLISLCELSVWMNAFLTSVTCCQMLSISWFSFEFIFSPGEIVGSAPRVPQSPLRFAFQKATENSVTPHDVQN